MYSKIAKLIDMGKWELAEKEFKLHISDEWTDELAILAAVIYLHNEQRDEAFESIRRGLQYNYRNYELYLILGNYYESNNINQAWLCYENAEFYCDNQEDLEIIRGYKKRLEKEKEWCVRPTSIVILSYNLKSVMKQCIESVRQNNPASSYEIIVVDNNSTDGVKEWLKEQKDIKLICNSENKGFPYGCNQGIKLAEQENNIFLLNNDTIVLPNSLFILRLGLYENGRVGATGSVTNFMGNEQLITEKYDTVEQYISYGIKHNLPEKNPYERKVFLCGFALLLKREALDSIGLLDTRFSPGQYEDDDIGVRLNYAGWLVLLCRNSFILHYGSGGGNNEELWNCVAQNNADKFKDKWNFDITYYTWSRHEIIDLIAHEYDQEIQVLEVGCGMGATLSRIQYLWPKAEIYGIELVDRVAAIGANYLNIIQGNVETMELPYQKEQFDYIILADVLEHLFDPEKTVKRLMPYLKKTGKFLFSIPNAMHKSVLLPLLQGNLDYQDEGILDRTHIRFFTLDSIHKLMAKCNLKIEKLSCTLNNSRMNSENKMLDALVEIPGVAQRELFEVYQFIIRAGKE